MDASSPLVTHLRHARQIVAFTGAGISSRNGTPYIIINQGPTEHDSIATVRLDGDLDTILPEAIAELS